MPYRRFLAEFRNKRFLASSLLGMFMLLASLYINFQAGTYATRMVSNRVSDLILDHVGPWNVDLLFFDGVVILWVIVGLLLLYMPRYIPFLTKAMSLFVLIRSFFIILTHLAPPHPVLPSMNFVVSKFTFGGDLFFSGHTGGPFMLALIFWHYPRVRAVFLALSFIFGTAAIVGHKHYSIDVFAAFFITYSIFQIARFFFTEDYALITHAERDHNAR